MKCKSGHYFSSQCLDCKMIEITRVKEGIARLLLQRQDVQQKLEQIDDRIEADRELLRQLEQQAKEVVKEN